MTAPFRPIMHYHSNWTTQVGLIRWATGDPVFDEAGQTAGDDRVADLVLAQASAAHQLFNCDYERNGAVRT